MFLTAIVRNVLANPLSASSVTVSWDSVDIPEISGYTVYYSQNNIMIGSSSDQERQSITVPSSINYVVIEGLLVNVEYQFQVVVVAEIDREVFMGETSVLTMTAAVLSISE